MTNCTEENNLSSSSTTPTEVPEDSSVFDNFASMNLELSNINKEDMRILRRVRIRSPPNIHMMNEVDDHSISGDEKGCFFYLILIIFLYVCEPVLSVCWYLRNEVRFCMIYRFYSSWMYFIE